MLRAAMTAAVRASIWEVLRMQKEDAFAIAVAIRELIIEANAIHDRLMTGLGGLIGPNPEVLISEAQGKLSALVTGLKAAAKSLEEKAES